MRVKSSPQRTINLVLACLFLATSQPLAAENLIEVYRKAKLNDPQILGAEFEHEASGESIDEARGRLLPQLSFEYSRSRTDQEITESTNIFQQDGKDDFPTTDYSLTLTQPLFNWSLYTGLKQARADNQRADAEYASQQQDLILRAAQAYLQVLAASDEVAFTRAEKAAVQKQLELVQNMMQSGVARKTELYDAQARFASVEADELSALGELDDKLEALREMVGELSGDLAVLKSELELVYPEPGNPETWMQAAIRQNPRVVQQARLVEVGRHEISLQKASHLPTLDLTARYSDRDTEGSLFGGGNEVESTDILLRLNIPLYQGGIPSSRTRRSVKLHQKAQQDLTAIQRAVQRAARAAYHGIVTAISRVEALAKSVSSQELALQSKQDGYRSGLYTNLDVLDAERDVYEAKRDYARARYDYLLNGLNLKHSVGTISEADIEGINRWLGEEG